MKGFLQDGNALFWERNLEKMCIEPWGSDSLRVRASMGTDIQMNLPGGLIDPTPVSAQIEIREDRAITRNGDITADLLVAPVLYEGARSRKVFLPAGTTWKDAWTDEVCQGGQTITANAPLKRLPLYLRGEKVLPIMASQE